MVEINIVDVAEVLMLFDDEDFVFAAVQHHLEIAAAILDTEFREYAPWQGIRVHVEDWQNLGDPSFKVHFRMSRAVFDNLTIAVENHLREKSRLHRKRTDIDFCLMMGLWILMNMDTFKNTALLFNTSPGVVFFHYVYIIEALREMASNYIQWPSREERIEIQHHFRERYGYPGAVGCIDGMHTFITAPLIEPQAYINRHHNYSILSQDHNLLIRDLYVGEPGSLHDSRMFRRSPLCSNLLENPGFLSPGEHIIGDGAYILTDKCMIPYGDNGALNEAQRYHNRKLSAVRSSVERGFCSTKARFPRLKYFRSLRVEYAVDHIVSSFVLHNFITLHGQEAPNFDFPAPNVDQWEGGCIADVCDAEEHAPGNFPNVNVEPDHPLLADARIRGDEKREAIAAMLFEERIVE